MFIRIRPVSWSILLFLASFSFNLRAETLELRSYTDLLEKSRQQAMKRLKNEAQKMGANAVVNVRFTTSTIAAGASEILIYGTAVKVQ